MRRELDLGDFVRRLDPAVREAAAIARRLEGRVANQPKAGETSEVKQALTDADTAAQEAILTVLLEHYPQVCLAAEEDTPTVASFPVRADSKVVIDPIDGTLHSYLEGTGPYAVMVGLTIRGEFEASLVALPREGVFFAASRGAGAGVARPATSYRPAALGRNASDRILVSHNTPEPVLDELAVAGFEVVAACGGAVSVAPLIAGVRAGLRYASGDLGISIRGRIGALIAREAGACVQGAKGGSFPSDLETPAPVLLVGATEADVEPLARALSAAGLA